MSKILIVDDELRVRDLIKKYAKFEGYEVAEASNGLKALELCKNHEFDIVIMDVMMPELDGFSACREIRKFSNVPIIILSARGEEPGKYRGAPCRHAALFRVLQQNLQRFPEDSS